MLKGFKYLDEDIKLDFEMTPGLKEFTDGCDKAFEEDDDDAWAYYWELVGVIAKNDHACGYITYEQMMAIWERYNTCG